MTVAAKVLLMIAGTESFQAAKFFGQTISRPFPPLPAGLVARRFALLCIGAFGHLYSPVSLSILHINQFTWRCFGYFCTQAST